MIEPTTCCAKCGQPHGDYDAAIRLPVFLVWQRESIEINRKKRALRTVTYQHLVEAVRISQPGRCTSWTCEIGSAAAVAWSGPGDAAGEAHGVP